MHDFYRNERGGSFELPVSSVNPQRTKSEVVRALAEFEQLALSSEDQGFLRLAQAVLTPEVATSRSRPGADWDGGLIS